MSVVGGVAEGHRWKVGKGAAWGPVDDGSCPGAMFILSFGGMRSHLEFSCCLYFWVVEGLAHVILNLISVF